MNRVATFNNKTLAARNGSVRGYRIDALLALAMAVPVAVVSAASVNAVVTFAIGSGTPTSGATQYLWYGKTLVVNFNETAATLNVKLRDILGVGNYTVAGGPLPGTGLTVTLTGNFAGRSAQTPAQVGSTTLSAGTPSATVTTLAVPKDRIMAWDPSKLATPAAVVYTASGTGSAWTAGSYTVQHTWETAAGESTPSPAAAVVLTAAQNIVVPVVNAAGTPDQALFMNVYVNGARVARIAVTTPGTAGNIATTNITGPAALSGADGKGVPDFNQAYLFADGRQNFLGFTKSAFETDANGNLKTQFAGKLGLDQAEILIGGTFQQSELAFTVGTISEFVAQVRPRITSGSIATGDAEISFGPTGDDAR
jgi:hypothetical protein